MSKEERQKDTESQKKDSKRKAEKIVLCPNRKDVKINFLDDQMKDVPKALIDDIVTAGDLIDTRRMGGKISPIFDEFRGSLGKLKILETKPPGRVKITEETIIKLLSRHPEVLNKEGLPKSKIIKVKNPPKDLSEFIEVSGIEDIKKVAEQADVFIRKYNAVKEVMYFADKYYITLRKS